MNKCEDEPFPLPSVSPYLTISTSTSTNSSVCPSVFSQSCRHRRTCLAPQPLSPQQQQAQHSRSQAGRRPPPPPPPPPIPFHGDLQRQMFIRGILALAILGLATQAFPFDEMLQNALGETNAAIDRLVDQWKIYQYPNFLQAAFILHSSWQSMKIKYQHKILRSQIFNEEVGFEIAFLGSSVTAGHDSLVNQSVVAVTHEIMKPVFASVGMNLTTRNLAMGNNPCVPYDMCPITWAGVNADIVQWEQTYNCNLYTYPYLFEQFIRQCNKMNNRPTVVFSDSSTPNWNEQDCPADIPATPVLETHDNELIDALRNLPVNLTEVNSQEVGYWIEFKELFTAYKTTGLQFYRHTHYESYKCSGPYVADWNNNHVAPWHPSEHGHQIRAAHMTFYWLLIFRDALQGLLDNHREGQSIQYMIEEVNIHLATAYHHVPEKPIYETRISEFTRCLTEYEPRVSRDDSIITRVIGDSVSSGRWKKDTIENLRSNIDPDLRKIRGYIDFKHMLYGNVHSGPLSVGIEVQKDGAILVCQPPGEWNKIPDGFTYLWKANTEVFVTHDVSIWDRPSFVFDRDRATKYEIVNERPQDSLTTCVWTTTNVRAGAHVVTIVPNTDEYVMVGVIVVT